MITHFPLLGAGLMALALGYTDYRTGRMPNLLTLGSLCAALAVRAYCSGTSSFGEAVLGLLLCGVAPAGLFFLTRGKGIGGGDVKALTALGAWLGPDLGLEAELFSLLLLAAGALVQQALAGQFRSLFTRSARLIVPAIFSRTPAQASGNAECTYVRFGPYLAVGVVLCCVNEFTRVTQLSAYFA
jgi:prepilin peptidase CpaA